MKNRIFVAQERYYTTGYVPPQGSTPHYGKEKIEHSGLKRGDNLYSVIQKTPDMNRNRYGYFLINYVAEDVSYMADYSFSASGEIVATEYTAVPVSCMKKVFSVQE